MTSNTSVDPIVQYFSNNSFIDYLPSVNSILLIVMLIAFYLLWKYIEQLPARIHKESIVKLEGSIAADLVKIKNKLDADLEILKIIQAQVEPQKVDIYKKLCDHFSLELSQNLMKDGKPVVPNLNFDKIYADEITSLFLFASDKTIKKYAEMKQNVESRKSLNLYFNLYADLVWSMRKDLQSGTKCMPSDFLNILGIKLSKEYNDKLQPNAKNKKKNFT